MYELIDQLTIAHDDGYISVDEMKTYTQKIENAIKLLNGYIRSLQKQKENAGK